MFNKHIKKAISKHVKQIKLLFFHTKQISTKRYPKKRIVVCFNGVLPHGGLVDRLKGIISYYDIAKYLNYDFYIQFDDPFELSVFLKPNAIDWKIEKAHLEYHPTKTKIVYTVNNFDINPLRDIETSNAETFLVYANIDYLNVLYPTKTKAFLEEKWRTHFNTLFLKSELLEAKLKEIETDAYICFHSRFTTLMGDFADTTSLVLGTKEKQELIQKLQKKIEETSQLSSQKRYMFSDSIYFLNAIKEKINIEVVEGKPFHMDNFDVNSSLESHLKTMLDFFMISKAEKVYLLNIGKMYPSSFSKYAAIIGEKPFEVITD